MVKRVLLNRLKKHIPNFITTLNLLAGCFSVYFALHGQLIHASWMIGLAAIFDFLDGAAARLLKSQSPMGKVLDSLADIVSFGLAPGFIAMMLIAIAKPVWQFLPFLALLVPVFSALRLAKFSIDDRQTEHFLGVPTPANALLFASFPLILSHPSPFIPVESILGKPVIMSVIVVVTSALLVIDRPILSMKFKDFSWLHNRPRYLLIGLTVVLLPLLSYAAVPIVFLAYLLISGLMLRR